MTPGELSLAQLSPATDGNIAAALVVYTRQKSGSDDTSVRIDQASDHQAPPVALAPPRRRV
jgi:hypothetical protein